VYDTWNKTSLSLGTAANIATRTPESMTL